MALNRYSRLISMAPMRSERITESLVLKVKDGKTASLKKPLLELFF